MDKRPKVSLEQSKKPSKLLALVALVIAFALPFILVKLFSHKQKNHYGEQYLTIPELREPNSIPATAVTTALAALQTNKGKPVNTNTPPATINKNSIATPTPIQQKPTMATPQPKPSTPPAAVCKAITG